MMVAPFPLAPFPRKGETARSLCSFFDGLPPPWGGPAEVA